MRTPRSASARSVPDCCSLSGRAGGSKPVIVIALSLLASTAHAQELVVSSDGLVEGEINGHHVMWRVQADGANAPVVNPSTARRIGLKTGLIGIGAKVLIGNVPVAGKTGVFRYTARGAANRRRGAWFNRPITTDGDGMLGPAALAQPVVTFNLRPTQAGETVHRFNLEDRGYAGMGVRLGDLFLQFDPASDETIATASAAAALAASNAGTFTGQPSTRTMRFGIPRPVRTLRLDRPLSIGGLLVTTLAVRLQDYGDASGIAEGDGDPDEIVVTAKSLIHNYRL
jgi:hypothetical protein